MIRLISAIASDRLDGCVCVWARSLIVLISLIALTQFPLYRKNNKVICKASRGTFAKLKMMALSGNREGGIFNRLSIFQLDGVEPSNNLEIIFSTLIEEFTSLKKQKMKCGNNLYEP